MTTAPDYLTIQGDVANGQNPYRASAADMGGTDKENDAEAIPDPNDPDAREWNQMVGQIAALIQVSPVAKIHVTFSGGVPSVFAVYSGNPDFIISDVTVVDVGTGITTLAVAADRLPDLRWGAAAVQATGNSRATAYRSAAQVLRVETYDADAGTAADVDFIADWG
jgi:hypothetical protein